MNHAMTTTAIGLEGFRIRRTLGANAVIGVRYDATELMQSVTEVICYDIAVVVEPA